MEQTGKMNCSRDCNRDDTRDCTRDCCRHDLLTVDENYIGRMPGEAGECWRRYPAVPLIYTRQEGWEDFLSEEGTDEIKDQTSAEGITTKRKEQISPEGSAAKHKDRISTEPISTEPRRRIRGGLSLPYRENGTRKRFVVYLPEDAVQSVRTPFAVAESMREDDGRIGALLREIAKFKGIRAGIYGSAALEWVSGYRYLTDTSDVDLIVEGSSYDALYALYHELPELEHLCQTNLDMELRFPGGRDVKFREMFGAQKSVMVKSVHNVELMPAEELWKLL